MERELLFYSLIIYLIFRFGGFGGLADGDGYKAVMPLSHAVWWYPTAYAAFVVLEPLVRHGLHAIGRREHSLLVVAVTLVWGICQGLNRKTSFTGDPLAVFTALYIVICYLRWYYENLPIKVAATMIVLGFFALIGQAIYGGMTLPWDCEASTWFAMPLLKLPVIIIAVGLVSLFARLDFFCSPVNCVAGSTFAAYLISENWLIRPLLWRELYKFGSWVSGSWAIPISVSCVFAAFAMCAFADAPRRIVFKLSVDRAPGAFFDRLWQKVEPRVFTALGSSGEDRR